MSVSQWITSGAGVAVILYIVAQGVYGLRAFGQVATNLKLNEQAMTAFKDEVMADIAEIKDAIHAESARRHEQIDNLNPTVGTLQIELGRVQGRLDVVERLVAKGANA